MGSESAADAGRGRLVGHTVGGHQISRLLGAGGMGEVYLARQQSLGMSRAIKIIHDDYQGDSDAFARFRREAELLSRLSHHNIIQIIDFGQLDNGWPYLCMEYVDGHDLDHQVATGGPMPLGDALLVLSQLAAALHYAHGVGVVHRDLKPGNVILRHNDPRQVKVIDFGLARLVSDELATRLTAEDQVMGSPLYLSPEQAVGSLDVTGAADVYALGGLAFELISGRPLFPEQPPLELIAAHAGDTPERLSVRCPHIPPLLDDLIDACLAKQPGHRPDPAQLDEQFTKLAQSLAADPALAATISPFSEDRGPTRRGSSAADVLMTAAKLDSDSSMRDALVNQAFAVVDDIASSLATRDADIARLRDHVREIEGQITDLEMELALLADGGDEARRNALAGHRQSLREDLRMARRALVWRAETTREPDDAHLSRLHRELADLISRLRVEVGE